MRAWSASSPARRRRSISRTRKAIRPSPIRPETGEEIYHSFLGVPILRAGNTLGVLVVQNRAKRTYVEEEVEALQTTAMVLAEMIASGELSSLAQPGAEPAARHSLHKTGADPVRRHRARPCRAARAARRHHQLHRRRPAEGNQEAGCGAGQAARRSRPHAGARRRRARAASTARCWKPIACSPTTMAGRTSCMRRSPPA